MSKKFIITDVNILVIFCCMEIDEQILTKNDQFSLVIPSGVLTELERWKKSPKKIDKFSMNSKYENILEVANREKYDPLYDETEYNDHRDNVERKTRTLKGTGSIKGCSEFDLHYLTLSSVKEWEIATQEHDLTKVAGYLFKGKNRIITAEEIIKKAHEIGLIQTDEIRIGVEKMKDYGERFLSHKRKIIEDILKK